MPELAEVAYFCRQWAKASGERVVRMETHPRSRIFRHCPAENLGEALRNAALLGAITHGKQMLFSFSGDYWISLHLGMTGQLRAIPLRGDGEPSRARLRENHVDVAATAKHDHLVLITTGHRLIFSDPRHFGRVRLDHHPGPPEWWQQLPPQVLSEKFTLERMKVLIGTRRSPVKGALLDQDTFPGIGNWMADEILWRAKLHPRRPCYSLDGEEFLHLHQTTRWVSREALRIIGTNWGEPPDTWLFQHRWKDGGLCPATGAPLRRETIAGRTTAWSPERQR